MGDIVNAMRERSVLETLSTTISMGTLEHRRRTGHWPQDSIQLFKVVPELKAIPAYDMKAKKEVIVPLGPRDIVLQPTSLKDSHAKYSLTIKGNGPFKIASYVDDLTLPPHEFFKKGSP